MGRDSTFNKRGKNSKIQAYFAERAPNMRGLISWAKYILKNKWVLILLGLRQQQNLDPPDIWDEHGRSHHSHPVSPRGSPDIHSRTHSLAQVAVD